MRTLVAVFAALAILGCAQPKSAGEIAGDIASELQSRAIPYDPNIPPPPTPIPADPPQVVNRALVAEESARITDLEIRDLQVGAGQELRAGSVATVVYVGMLPDEYVFDTTYRRDGEPFTFEFGPDAGVIEGWREGLKGMRVGGKRVLRIPAHMAYGANPPQGSAIPPNAALVFHVELIFVQDP